MLKLHSLNNYLFYGLYKSALVQEWNRSYIFWSMIRKINYLYFALLIQGSFSTAMAIDMKGSLKTTNVMAKVSIK